MHKVIAEIIAGVIPHKQTRNRWRGILRFGLLNSIRLKKEIKKTDKTPENYLSVVVIAKNEGPYFKEWLDWHIKQGVEKFYVYDNESTDCTSEVLQPYIEKGLVDYTYYQGYRKQLAAYDDCLRKHRYDTRWLAVIDMDEFIIPLKDSSVREYLKGMEEFPVVEINWLCYGSSGHKDRKPGGVMERFRKHSNPLHPLNKHVKSIFNPRRVYGMIGCHEVARIDGKAVDSNGERVKISWRDRPPVHDKIRINHYAVRSYEEFIEKKARGRASGRTRQLLDDYFHQYDLNDIEDQA